MIQLMRDILKGQSRADESIFWFGLFWHNGRDEFYRAMVATGYEADQHRQRQIAEDPEIQYGLTLLTEAFRDKPLIEYPLYPIKLAEVEEGDVLMSDANRWACIRAGMRWPCKVHKWHGTLGVPCAEDGAKRHFHPLEPDGEGVVIGFKL